jgi:signal peptide peptidase SppA
VATFVEGMMASAAAWIGTAADVVVMDSATAQAGSIGVVATHTDVSKQQEALGVKTTEIVAGKYKRAASQYGALTETGQQVIQDQVDYLYSLFVADVAENRGVSTDQVLSNMADGRMFIGQQAIDAGLVDRITSLETLISELNASADQQDQRLQPSASFSMESPSQLAASWAAENSDAAALLRAEGGAVERDRIAAVRAQSMPGHEALIDQLAADGNTSGPEAAVQVLAAERALRANQSAVRLAESPEPVAFAPAPEAPAVQAEKPEPTPLEIAREARRIHGEEAAAGRQIAFTDAVAQAQSNLSA